MPRADRALKAVIALIAIGVMPGPAQGDDADQLRLVDAVRSTIERQPQVIIQRHELEASRGDIEAQAGVFDWSVKASGDRTRDRSPLTSADRTAAFDEIITDGDNYGVGVQKAFHSGLTAGLSAQVARQSLNTPVPITNRSVVTLSFAQPLLRGFGPGGVEAGERAAMITEEAVSRDLRQTVANSVAQTVSAYWNYATANEARRIAEESEARFHHLVDEARELVKADQMAAAELNQLRANLAGKVASRLGAEQTLLDARHQLGLATGAPYEEFVRYPLPVDTLPEPDASALPQLSDLETLITGAIARRDDLAASKQRIASAAVAEEAAENGLKPRFDLSVNVGYAGLQEGIGVGNYFSPFDRRVSGLNASASIAIEWPVNNRTAEGRLVRGRAATNQARIAADNVERTIRSGVTVALGDLHSSAARYESARESSTFAEAAVEGEREKLRAGTGTVIDLILTEDNLTQAQLQVLSARQTYANALVRLRFELGLLGNETEAFDLATLTSVPRPSSRP
jgi:outer membrane protein TolC